ncbi:MAG: transporter permease [Actinomycetia bacterium]|nr:transporter permease [Actinomycetes bacterium]
MTVIVKAKRVLGGNRASLIGFTIVGLNIVVALAAPLLSPGSPVKNDGLNPIAGPSLAHLAGTDKMGRDVLSRTLYGGRIALTDTLLATVATIVAGTALGCIVAYRRGWLDEIVMRLVDAVLSVPALLSLLVIVTVLGSHTWVLVVAITVVYAPSVARVIRAAALEVVPRDYVTAARARGERMLPILWREVLPNVLDVVLVECAMRASWVVLLVSSLSFLGVGANPPTPDWGLMVADNSSLIAVAPWASLAPIVALASLVVGLNLAADGLSKSLGVDRMRGNAA